MKSVDNKPIIKKMVLHPDDYVCKHCGSVGRGLILYHETAFCHGYLTSIDPIRYEDGETDDWDHWQHDSYRCQGCDKEAEEVEDIFISGREYAELHRDDEGLQIILKGGGDTTEQVDILQPSLFEQIIRSQT